MKLMVTRSRQVYRPRCFLEPAVSATVSKIVSNTITYPIESVRLISMIPRSKRDTDPSLKYTLRNLYRGYPGYLPYSVMNYVITYQAMFVCMEFFKATAMYEVCLLASSVCTCLLTSLYKVPCMYFFKNKVVNQVICFRTLLSSSMFRKAYGILLLEDIPEMCIKFYLNHFMHTVFPGLSELCQALFIGMIATLLLTPIDIVKNTVFCNLPQPKSVGTTVIRVSCSIINTTLFFFLFNGLKRG